MKRFFRIFRGGRSDIEGRRATDYESLAGITEIPKESIRICLLGSAGFIPTGNKETMSVLLIQGKTAILLDAGTGIRRFTDPRIQHHLQGIDTLNVLFSHLHHDHTCGFTWLLRLWTGEIKVYVPSQPLVEYDGIRAMGSLTSPPLFALPLAEWRNCKGIIAIQRKELDIEGITVRIIPQRHRDGSIGFRMGNFAYITDTEPRRDHAEFLQDCDLVLMDTMHDIADFHALNVTEAKPADHGYSVGNARVAVNAHVRRLGLVHIDPLYDAGRVSRLLQETQDVFPGAFIPEEGQFYYVNA